MAATAATIAATAATIAATAATAATAACWHREHLLAAAGRRLRMAAAAAMAPAFSVRKDEVKNVFDPTEEKESTLTLGVIVMMLLEPMVTVLVKSAAMHEAGCGVIVAAVITTAANQVCAED